MPSRKAFVMRPGKVIVRMDASHLAFTLDASGLTVKRDDHAPRVLSFEDLTAFAEGQKTLL